MTRRLALALLVVVTMATGAIHTAGLPLDAQQTTFRAAASAVTVDVSVRDKSRRAISGLDAGDFEIFDNGVKQEVDQVSYGQLPIDITVALDVSYSVTGAQLDTLRRSLVQLMGDLGPDDRLKLVLFNMGVNRTVDFTNDVKAVEGAIRGVTATGGTALLDAISVALVSAATPDRRQLVVFFTDGSDTTSVTTPKMLTSVAQHTRATLTFVVAWAGSSGATSIILDSRRGGVTIAAPQPLFRELASETGGAVLPVDPRSDVSSTFRRILADFRSAYVLFYNAQGVDRSGYHTIDVKVNRENAVVTARRGYFGS